LAPAIFVSLYFLRASFKSPTGFWILPSTLSLLPSANQLFVAEHLAGRFLYGAPGLLGRAGYTIFVQIAQLHRVRRALLEL
jgi:hypothetical protein